jgi:threonine aldolase
MVDRLAEDHANARYLAHGLAQIPGIRVDHENVRTNIVFFDLDEESPRNSRSVATALQGENLWIGAFGQRSFRAVTHYWVGRREVDRLLGCLRMILSQ